MLLPSTVLRVWLNSSSMGPKFVWAVVWTSALIVRLYDAETPVSFPIALYTSMKWLKSSLSRGKVTVKSPPLHSGGYKDKCFAPNARILKDGIYFHLLGYLAH